MGIESYRMVLKPSIHVVAISEVISTLLNIGFTEDAYQYSFGADSYPIHFADENTYTLNDGTCIIEGLIKSQAQEKLYLSHLSLRFAICQPLSVVHTFVNIITRLNHDFQIVIDGDSTSGFMNMRIFEQNTLEKVSLAKQRWVSIFEGDTEELAMSVGQSWQYFRNKHPAVFVKK